MARSTSCQGLFGEACIDCVGLATDDTGDIVDCDHWCHGSGATLSVPVPAGPDRILVDA